MTDDEFWQNWLTLWNGDFSRTEEIIGEDFSVHAAMVDGSDSAAIRGGDGLTSWIGSLRQAIGLLRFETVVGPIRDGDLVAGHWRASGEFTGGFPGAAAPPGTPFVFNGTDIVRLRDGRAVEYWLVSDTLSLMSQLQVSG